MMEAGRLTSDIHATELGNNYKLTQVVELDDGLQIVQHPRNAMPLRSIGSSGMESVEMRDSGDRST